MPAHTLRFVRPRRPSASLASVAMAGLVFASAGAQTLPVVLNEVLYDPAGTDAGHEFVELFNASESAVELEGWRLEAGNGARPGDWRPQWAGGPGDRLAPRGFFLIAGALVADRADSRVALELQNGPDALRLVSPRGAVDLLGWGALASDEYYRGRPAEDVSGGSSLARLPDGFDTRDNAADFHARARPTPGKENAPERMISLGDVRWDPPVLDPESTVRLIVSVANLGRTAVDPALLAWGVQGNGVTGRLLDPPASIHPQESLELIWELSADGSSDGPGRAVLVTLSLNEEEGGASAAHMLRIGRGDVLISEVQYDPPGDEGEWVELWNASDALLSLAGWSLRDSSGRTTRLMAGELPGGAFAVVAEDGDAFRRSHPDLAPGTVLAREDAWPALNNTLDRQAGYADEIVVLDAAEIVSDYIRYAPGELDGNGVSLERWIDGRGLVDPQALIPCPAASGSTPGYSSRPVDGSDTAPRFVRPDPDPFQPWEPGSERLCMISIPDLGAGGEEVTAEIFSLAGLRVATLTAAARTAGPLVLAWNGRSSSGDPLPTGLYLVKASVKARSSSARATHLVPLALRGPR